MRSAFRALRDHAAGRGVEFLLSLPQFRGFVETTDYIARKGTSATDLHIDRIKASLPYQAGNLQILTCSENATKGNRERWQEGTTRKIKAAEMSNSSSDDNPF